ncbi:unnamed protein product [Prunus armeniaca]|uniref:Uncharacterized protein n=1 Tax=Prunus armeniaca TaxID=36596 RepID=A0A6J5U1C3_PRUAR|nr:unnamed protein product [Prunus armeniaca]
MSTNVLSLSYVRVISLLFEITTSESHPCLCPTLAIECSIDQLLLPYAVLSRLMFMNGCLLWLLPDSHRLVSLGVFTNSCSSGCHRGPHLGAILGNSNSDDS